MSIAPSDPCPICGRADAWRQYIDLRLVPHGPIYFDPERHRYYSKDPPIDREAICRWRCDNCLFEWSNYLL